MNTAVLLVELFAEELPPKALKKLGEAFAEGLAAGLACRDFLSPKSEVSGFATPRRLAVSITDVLDVAPDAEIIDKLMPVKVARDASGQPSIALQKKLGTLGRAHLATATLDAVDGPDRIYIENDGKADYVHLRSLAKGQDLVRGLQSALDEVLAKLPIPKVMSYAAPGSYYNDVKFVRPAHKLVALHGADVVPVRALDLDAGRVTDGHRFLSHPDVKIQTAGAYESTLEAEGKVIPSFAARRAAIVVGLEGAAGNATPIMPDALLDEVTALVEWPVVYAGTFDAAFLDVPQECLILTMQLNQRYFALADDAGKLVSRFLLVSNIETSDPSAIISGNERVLRARLADAKFFFDQDRKQTLESRLPKLASVVYHNKLGTQADRAARVGAVAARIAVELGADPALALRAARLAKADLVTDMVGEFPELQGLMGRYYAENDGEPPQVSAAIEQHYWPRFAGDALPEGPVAQSVALADKLDTLVGIWGIGLIPTGDKDPFGLRRHALGVLRILLERGLPLELPGLLRLASEQFAAGAIAPDTARGVQDFMLDRLRQLLRDGGAAPNDVDAVLADEPARIDLVAPRLEAVQAFAALPEAAALAAANKRIVNILRKSGDEAAPAVDRGRLADGAEHDLFMAFQKLMPQVEADFENGDFTAALRALATAKPVVDRYFDDVMVMVDDPAIRANRLALLRSVAATMNRVADISKLAQ
jgi:glycyl-tRNA synthetase beta chain